MSGNSEGGKKVAEKLKTEDPDYYKKLGSMGGKTGNHHLKGFAVHRDLARKAGKKGGSISKRNKE